MSCELCQKEKNEGNVCHSCRSRFEPLSESIYEFYNTLECYNCDEYGFPCMACAKYTFDGNLGRGNGYPQDFDDHVNETTDLDILSIEAMLKILGDRLVEKSFIEMGLTDIDLDNKDIVIIQCTKCKLFTPLSYNIEEEVNKPCNRCHGKRLLLKDCKEPAKSGYCVIC